MSTTEHVNLYGVNGAIVICEAAGASRIVPLSELSTRSGRVTGSLLQLHLFLSAAVAMALEKLGYDWPWRTRGARVPTIRLVIVNTFRGESSHPKLAPLPAKAFINART